MSATKIDLDSAAKALREQNYSQASLDLIKGIIGRQEGIQLVEKLIQSERANGLSEDDAVSKVMTRLESFFDRSQVNALVLMACLWPIASPLFLHDVCNAIDLWMCENMSETVKRCLKVLISREADEDVQRHYKQWVDYEIRLPQP